MYDFANSAFTTTITTVVYSVYFANRVVPSEGVRAFGVTLGGNSLWPIAYATSLAIAAALAPVIGAICDYSAAKKRWLTIFWLVGCAATCGLFFVRPGGWVLGMVLYVVANVAWESSVSLNSAFLPELAPPEKLDRVSSIGWGIGYVGGGLCLILNLLMYKHPERFPHGLAINFAVASVGVWWFIFGLPCILGVRERARPRPPPAGSLFSAGFARVLHTTRNVRRFRTLAMLTGSVLIFSAGVNTVLAMSGPFAEGTLHFKQDDLILCFLMIQGVGAVGAILTAIFAGRVPTKQALYGMLAIWLIALVWALVVRSQTEFWFLGALIGLVMGGTQALSRGLQAQLTPPSATAEFFGFYGVTQKIAAAGANYIFAAASALGGTRVAIVTIMCFFLLGFALLKPVDVAKGRRESEDEEKRLQAAA
jgi:UMF1 family MFS transporter